MKLLSILLLFSSVFAQALGVGSADNARALNSISTFVQAQGRNSCSNDRKPALSSACPQVLLDLAKEDKDDSSAGLLKSRYSACEKGLTKADAFRSPRGLAIHLKSYQGANLSPLVHDQAKLCTNPENADSNHAVAKYYYYHNRIEKAQTANLEEMASIDSILGKKPLENADCKSLNLKSVQEKCESLKANCAANPESLKTLSEKTEKAQKEIENLTSELKDLRSKFKPNEKSYGEAVRALQWRISVVKSHVPWIEGNEYQQQIKAGKNSSDAVKAQLIANRKALETTYNHGDVAQMCLAGSSNKNCTPENIRKYIDKAPDIIDSYDTKNGLTKDHALAGQEYMRFEQCVHEGTMDRLQTAETINGAALDAGFAVVSGGLSYWYSAPKMLLAARQLMMAKYAYRADQAFNAGYFAGSLKKAADACLKNEQVLQAKPNDNKCTANSVYAGSNAMEAYDDCVTSLAFAGLDGLPLAAGTISRYAKSGTKYKNMENASEANALIKAKASKEDILKATGKLDDKKDGGAARLALAESVVGRKLSTEEKSWVLEAHNRHSDKGYKLGKDKENELSEGDLRRKLKDRPKTLTQENSRDLVEAGILGTPVPFKGIEFIDGRTANLPPALSQDQVIDKSISIINELDKKRIDKASLTDSELKGFVEENKKLYASINGKVYSKYEYEADKLITSHESSSIRIFGADQDFGEEVVKALKKRGGNVAGNLDKEMDNLQKQADKYFESAKAANNELDYYRGVQLMNARKQIGYAAEDMGIATRVDGSDASDQLTAAQDALKKDRSLKDKFNNMEKIMEGR